MLFIGLISPQKYGQPCNVQFDKCLQNSKCIDGICKCPLGMEFSSINNQCEDIRNIQESTTMKSSISEELQTLIMVTAPIHHTTPSIGLKYNEINTNSNNNNNERMPLPVSNNHDKKNLNIPGNFVKLGAKCNVGHDICPDNAHCLFDICVCKPGFVHQTFDETCRNPNELINTGMIHEKSHTIPPSTLSYQSYQQSSESFIQNTFQTRSNQPQSNVQPLSMNITPQIQTQSPVINPSIQTFNPKLIVRHTIGETCQNIDDCINGAVCVNGLCKCPLSTIEKEGKCLKVAFSQGAAMPGESCENGELCTGGSLCDSGMKKCICAAGHDGTRGTCIKNGVYASLPGEMCQERSSTITCTGGSTCVNNVCSCDHDHYAVDGYCRPISAPNSDVEYLPSTGLRFRSNPLKQKKLAEKCDPIKCQLPTCFCSVDGKQIPGNLRRDETPQFVVLTFDDAVNGKSFSDYKYLFNKNYKNPNNCPLKGTFFVSHEWTNYDLVQWIYKNGHEIASNSISHINSQGSSETTWLNEMDGMRRILAKFGNVPEEEIVGIRAPQLSVGGDNQFEMMQRAGFLYDNTISPNSGYNNDPYWPQTLDYKLSWTCPDNNCPKSSFPGIWEIPLNQFYGSYMNQIKSYKRSSMLRAAVDLNSTIEELTQILINNFERSYKNNKAPYILSLNADFLQLSGKNTGMLALENLIQYLQNKNDVYFITMKALISWMQDPKPINRMNEFPDVQCPMRMSSLKNDQTCENPNKCIFPTPSLSSSEHQFLTCNPCPSMYPWLENPMGILDF